MNIREYIESGVIELYVMNALTAQEAAEVEAMARQYPEIQVEIGDAERAMQAYAQSYSIAPRPELKDEILNKIKNDTDINNPTETQNTVNNGDTKPPLSILSYLPWGIVALFGISTLLLYNTYRTLKADKEKCEQEQNIQNLKNQKAIADVEFKLNILKDNTTVPVKLLHPKGLRDFEAIVYWNAKQKATLLTINNLPNPTNGKQYQLWAIVNKTPVDAGIIEFSKDTLYTMKIFDKAEAFAITLEPVGGSREPTLSDLFVIGTIN